MQHRAWGGVGGGGVVPYTNHHYYGFESYLASMALRIKRKDIEPSLIR